MILFFPTGITNIPDGAHFRFLRDVFIHFLEKNMTVNNPNCEILCNSIIFPSTRPDEVERLYARCFEQASAWVQLQRGTTKMRKLLPKLRVAVYSSVIRTSRQLDDLCAFVNTYAFEFEEHVVDRQRDNGYILLSGSESDQAFSKAYDVYVKACIRLAHELRTNAAHAMATHDDGSQEFIVLSRYLQEAFRTISLKPIVGTIGFSKDQYEKHLQSALCSWPTFLASDDNLLWQEVTKRTAAWLAFDLPKSIRELVCGLKEIYFHGADDAETLRFMKAWEGWDCQRMHAYQDFIHQLMPGDLLRFALNVYESRLARPDDFQSDRIAAVMDVLCSTFPECDKKKFKRVYLSSTDIFISDPLVANTPDLFF